MTKPHVWTWTLLAAASLSVLASAPAQYFGRQHDDVLFVIASLALSDGRYSLFTSPGNPPLVGVWPGLPALLLPATWAGGGSAGAYQALSALLLAACPWALWWWLKGRASPATSVLIPVLFATSPLVLNQAGCVMPEAPYTALSALLLVLLEAPRPDAKRAGWLLAALIQLRSAGLSLFPAVLAGPVLERRWRVAARRLAPGAAGLLLWCAWCLAQEGRVQEAGEWAASYRGRGFAAIWSLPLDNWRFYTESLGNSFLPASWAGGLGARALGALAAVAAAAGAARAWRRSAAEPAVWLLAGGAAMHAFWGWQYERYMIPFLPFLWWAVSESLGRRAPVVLSALLACQVTFNARHFLGAPAPQPELASTYAWLRERMEPSDALASLLYARDGFYASRASVPLADAEDAQGLARLLRSRRVRYVLWQDLEGDLGLSARATSAIGGDLRRVRALLADARRFRPVYEDPAGRGTVYEVAD
ncbi:MAG: hypothetical protein HY554_08280 [Elusimicrobia bacterium]|nr:hypothetical protein [Elusimicrobiota bacterium]